MINGSAKSVEILIVDDHPIMYQGLKQLLADEKDLIVYAGVKNAQKAFSSLKEKIPDLIIIDISLKDSINGIELIKELKMKYPKLKILVLSMHEESFYAERALRAGARGYVMKSEFTGVIVNAIRRVLAGKIYLNDEMSSLIMDKLIGDHRSDDGRIVNRLSDRELEVFQFIGKGYGTNDIASKLYISTKTVETYIMRIKDKLGLKNSTELKTYAIEWVHNK